MRTILFAIVVICFYCTNVFSQNRSERILEVHKPPHPREAHNSILSDSSRVFKDVNGNVSINEKGDTLKVTDRILILKAKKEDENP